MHDVLERVKSQFGVVYLTLISVIQASVLSYLFSVADRLASLPNLRTGLLLIGSFLTVGMLWNEYVMGSTTFRWIPGLQDAFLPLLLGVCQFYMARSIAAHGPAWFFWMAGLCLFGFLSFVNRYRSARRYPENRDILVALGPWVARTEGLMILSVAGYLLMGWLDLRIDAGRGTSPVAAIVSVALQLGYFTRVVLYWKRIAGLDKH